MRELTNHRKGAIGIAVVALVLVLAVLTVSLAGQSGPPAQAHEDGTRHIHPTLTPTPEPTPTPLPALGLNGPLSLETGVIYQQQQHRLVVTTVVNNPPPEGWHFEKAEVAVIAEYKGWHFSTNAYTWERRYQIALQDDVLTAFLPLPEYARLCTKPRQIIRTG